MKKLLSIALCLVLIFCAMPVFAFSANAATSGVIGNCTWEVNGTCLTISGSGTMFMGGSSQMPWKDCYISEVVIEEGVTEICNYAFYKLDITRVELPSTVYSIGSNAFQNTPLQEIVLGRVHTVGSYAFFDCDSLEHIWYGGDLTSKYNMQISHGNNDFKDAEWHFLICDSSMHSYENDCDTDCNICGDVREVPDHTYDDIFDPDCNVCGDVREIVLSDGWVLDGENWFYIIEGERATGWQFLGDVWYYFNDDGIMQTGWVTAGGNKYLFDASGHWVEGAYTFVIDLSRWQGNVKWDKLAQTDVDGVILRISYGGTTDDFNEHKDAKFEEYLENVKRLQMPYGVYHFNTATTVEMAQLQANNVVSLLKQSGANPDLPVFVDIETNGGDCDLNEIAKVYISTFIANGYKPGIYSNEYYWKNYLNSSEFNAYYKWISSYGSNDGYPKASFSPEGGIENYVMWQYTSAGKISGIDENTVDFNALFNWYEKPDGWTEILEKRYHYSNGRLTYGWLLENGNWYYLNSMGEAVTGWLLLGDTWYYLKENGVMQTGWLLLGNTWYYFADGGNMVTGWQLIGGTWYYFHAGGNMATGWLNLGGTWYYLATGGNMVTGWQNIGGTWYYFNAGGDMATGWLLLGSTWYYLADGGAMLTGWQYIGGTWYYFNEGGAWVA